MAEDRRVFCTGCKQTFITDAVGKCPLCGEQDALKRPEHAEVYEARELAARAKEPTVDPVRAVYFVRAIWIVLKLGAAAVFFVFLGWTFLFDKELRGHGGAPQATDLAFGIPILVLGLVLAAVCVVILCRPK